MHAAVLIFFVLYELDIVGFILQRMYQLFNCTKLLANFVC